MPINADKEEWDQFINDLIGSYFQSIPSSTIFLILRKNKKPLSFLVMYENGTIATRTIGFVLNCNKL